MTLGWSDGVSFLPLDFILGSSSKASKRLQGIRKEEDKRAVLQAQVGSMDKSTERLESMGKRVLALGIRVDYLLLDSWFAFPALLATLGKHLPLICMGKDMPKVFYRPSDGSSENPSSLQPPPLQKTPVKGPQEFDSHFAKNIDSFFILRTGKVDIPCL